MAYNTTETLDKLACTNNVDFRKCKDRFGRISWSKNDSNYLEIKLKCSREMTKMQNFDWDKTSQWENLFQPVYSTKKSTSCCSRQLSQRTKFCRQFFNLHSPKTCRNNWSLCTRWLTLWIVRTERFVWHCSDTRRTTQRPPMLKFVYSDRRRRKKDFSKWSMSIIDLTNLYIFLTSWIQCMIK